MQGKAGSTPPVVRTFKVLKERSHGGLIHGKRRTVGEAFDAPESAMTFDVLEGVVEMVAPAAADAPTQSAPQPATQG